MTVASPKPIPNATHRIQQRAGKDRITWRRDERTEGHIDGYLANGTLVIAKSKGALRKMWFSFHTIVSTSRNLMGQGSEIT